MSCGEFKRLDAESWLIRRLGQHGSRIEEGVTDYELRKARIREAILGSRLSEVIIGRGADGKSQTYRQAYERFYNQRLEGENER